MGPRTVAALLHEAGYSLQANRKTREGLAHPDRNAQSEYINARVAHALMRVVLDTLHQAAALGREQNTRASPRPP